jgi:hypothetical protein
MTTKKIEQGIKHISAENLKNIKILREFGYETYVFRIHSTKGVSIYYQKWLQTNVRVDSLTTQKRGDQIIILAMQSES